MSKLILLCGFIGSGKSTYAQKLSQQRKAFVFSPDEWMIPMFGEHMERELFDQRLDTFIRLFQRSALRLLAIGVPVVFDFGFWDRRDRAEMAHWAKSEGIEFEFHYLDTPKPICFERALARNAVAKEQSFQMTTDMLELFWSKFETPGPIELQHMIRISPPEQ